MAGERAWPGTCMARGMHGWGACMARGCAWPGTCMARGMHGQGHAWPGVDAWQRGTCVAKGRAW